MIKAGLWFKFFLVFLSVALILGAGFLVFNFFNYEKIRPGVKIGELDLGGLNRNEARKLLEEKINDFANQPIEFRLAEKSWTLTPKELGVKFEKEKILDEVMTANRGNGFLSDLEQQIVSRLFQNSLPASFKIDNEKLGQFREKLATAETSAVSAVFKYNAETRALEIEPEKTGLVINKKKLINDLNNNFGLFVSAPISLSMEKDRPEISTQALEAQKSVAEKIIGQAPITLKIQELSWSLDKAQLADWLIAENKNGKIELNLDQEKIKNFLSSIAPSVNREPQDAKLAWSGQKIEVFALSRDGQTLNLEVSAQKITEDILNGQNYSPLVVDSVPAKITSTGYENLGLTTLLGRGESNFSGSSKNRINNIQVGTTKLNGVLLELGQEFSFANFIGEISEQTGYLPELVIKKNETVPEYGGGVCQISTTVFRAAVNSGLKILERHPHAFPVRYYNPPGFDATVYPPSPDLRFLNDTPGYLLIQGKVSGIKLIFDFYGTNDGRKIKIKGPTILESHPDGSMKTILTQEIWRDGVLERQSVFRSNYQSADLFPTPTPSPTP